MGELSTYGELKAALLSYSGRAGSAAVVAAQPLFVRRAHDVLARKLRIPLMQATADVVIDAERVTLPADFRAAARFAIDTAYDDPMSPTSVENRLRVASTNAAGRPTVFAIEGDSFAFGPRPDATYTGKLLYYRALPFFGADGDANALLTKHPFAYLYGALAELARFDKADEDTAVFETMFQAELAEIEVSEQRDAMMGGTLAPMPSAMVTP